MGKFRHTLRRWRSAILKDGEGPELSPLSIPTNKPVDDPWNPYLQPLLDLSTITINRTWKDIPQEIVNHIMFMLGRDLKSLKACSLTCKALFLSARPFIHKRIYLTSELNWEMLTLREKQRYIRDDRQGLALKTLSGAAAHGLLQFGRHLLIHVNQNFTPTNLQPFNDHFQCFDRIQELGVYHLHTRCFLEQFDTFLANFVPTLRSLHLDMPTGDGQDILNFVCRFPHLDDLTLKMSSGSSHPLGTWEYASPSIPMKIPPFRGRLRLDGIYGRNYCMLRQLLSLPGKRRFRFIDFRGCPTEVEQPIIEALSGTMETLSITWKIYSRHKGLPLDLVNVQNLRSLTLRVPLAELTDSAESLSQTLHTIISPFFSEFVLEVENMWWALRPWWPRAWADLDKMFETMDKERGVKVIVRTERVDDEAVFIAVAKERLPLMDARGRLIIVIGPFPEK